MKLTDFEQPSVAVDVVVFTIYENDLKVLLIKRGIEPFKGKWAIPGGFVRINENLEDAAVRELKEETGVEGVYLEQLYTFGDVKRDPRGRVISVSYFALINSKDLNLKSSEDALEAKWFSVNKLPSLSFDHKKILDYSLKRLRWKFEYTPIGFSLLPKKFSLGQLKGVYDIVFDKKFDKRNFVKKVLSLNILKEEGINQEVPYRPPMMYSLKKDVGEFVELI